MDKNGFPGKLTRLIKATMDGNQCCVRISAELSGSFESLSCLLFNIALEGVMRRVTSSIFDRSSQFICFADDVEIVGRTFEAMTQQYTRLKREAEKNGLETNTSKTKYMLLHDDDELEVVDEFVYLSSLLTSDNNTSREIQRRIINGSRTYNGLHKHLLSNRLNPRTKCTLYKTLLRSVVLYGHET